MFLIMIIKIIIFYLSFFPIFFQQTDKPNKKRNYTKLKN